MHTLDRLEALDVAHFCLCVKLDQLRYQAWRDQGSPMYGPHRSLAASRWGLTKWTPLMERVDATIDKVEDRMRELEEDLSALSEGAA